MFSKVAITVLGLALAAGDNDNAPDGWLTTKARMALIGTEGVSSNDIAIDSDDGVVTIYGKVETAEAKANAAAAVAKLEGVKRVDNLLQVVAKADKKVVEENDDNIKKALGDRLKKEKTLGDVEIVSVDKGVVILGGEVKDISHELMAASIADMTPGVRRVESKIKLEKTDSDKSVTASNSDMRITRDVKIGLLGDEDASGTTVRVDTNNGVVTLFGSVPSDKERKEAARIAKGVKGVKNVRNEIAIDNTLAKKENIDDAAIAQEVERILTREALPDVDVAVKNGVVKLSGKVDSEGQKTKAAIASSRAKGARAVKNNDVRVTKD